MLLDDEDSADEDEDEDEVRNKRKQDERAPALVGATTDLIPGVYEGMCANKSLSASPICPTLACFTPASCQSTFL